MRVASALIRSNNVVSMEQRVSLEAEFSNEEMKKALWDILGDEAPRPDGFGR